MQQSGGEILRLEIVNGERDVWSLRLHLAAMVTLD